MVDFFYKEMFYLVDPYMLEFIYYGSLCLLWTHVKYGFLWEKYPMLNTPPKHSSLTNMKHWKKLCSLQHVYCNLSMPMQFVTKQNVASFFKIWLLCFVNNWQPKTYAWQPNDLCMYFLTSSCIGQVAMGGCYGQDFFIVRRCIC